MPASTSVMSRSAFSGRGVAGFLAAALLQAGAAAQTAAQIAAPSPGFSLRALDWLAGCWQSEVDDPGSGEQWMAPAGGTMLGMARTLKDGRMVQHEFMVLRETAAGLVVFTAHPAAQAGTSFVATEVGRTGAVFENRGQDFPQRVIYQLRPDGRLAARIEGLRNGELRGVDFPMRRGACDAPSASDRPGG